VSDDLDYDEDHHHDGSFKTLLNELASIEHRVTNVEV
jgi:hypothetical protein